MINVQNDVEIEQVVNRNIKYGARLSITNHWSDNKLIHLKYTEDGEEILDLVVKASDIIEAVKNSTNTNKY